MQEHHPIDELFREALHGSGKAPPPHVRGAVLGAVRSRRRWALWRKRSVLALLILVAGAGGIWGVQNSINNGPAEASDEQRIEAPFSAKVGLSNTEPAESVRPDATHSTELGELESSSLAAADARVELTVEATRMHTDRARATAGVSRSLRDRAVLITEPDPSSGTALTIPVGGPSFMFADLIGTPAGATRDATRMALLRTAPSSTPLSRNPTMALTRSLPRLSRGDYWLAIHAAPYSTKHHWSGTETTLADALNESERSRPSISLGILAGRQWRSGFGIAAGAEVERTEQEFRHTESLVHEEESVIANMVTLNTIVYSISYDTLTSRYAEQITAEGRDLRTIVRIPLEVYWHGIMHHWVVGARAGVAGEFTLVRSNASLVQDADDGTIRSRAIGPSELASRYPTCILGTGGVDIGYVLGERTTLLATPQYQFALGGGPRNSLSTTPERIGVRLQLMCTL